MEIINLQQLTKDYGNNKGIFDVNLTVNKGEIFGFLGPNGAGKTTTIRALMGFIHVDKGICKINGLDCFMESHKIKENLGYLAGELSFFDDLKGVQLLTFMSEYYGIKNKTRMQELMKFFELDPNGRIHKMSKGMKQKLGIILAFMNQPEIVILDEPTSGLDPLMQNRFVELLLEEKKKGTTIFMSSHIFEEIEKTCDRTAIIKNGKIVAIEKMADLQGKRKKQFKITFEKIEEINAMKQSGVSILKEEGMMLIVEVDGPLNDFLRKLSNYSILDLEEKKPSLEEMFLHFYGR